jgi:predicted helicase
MQTIIRAYLRSLSSLYAQGITTEHSFRGALETLLRTATGLAVVNEAQHIACGAPDLTLLKNEVPVGYVEAKNVGENLSAKEYKTQLDRYKKALANLIITDYLTFQLFEGENFVTEVSIGKILPNKIEPIPENFDRWIGLIGAFAGYNGQVINDSKKLATYMAAKTQLLADVIEKNIADSLEDNHLRQQLYGFRQVLLPSMTEAQFADIYAQTIAYGMFVACFAEDDGERSAAHFTRQRAEILIPKSHPFLKNLFHYIAYDLDESVLWLVDSLADMFNYVDITAIHEEFESEDKDPFLHFYEDFLTQYDKQLKNAMGAYYTPTAVVKFIVRAVDDLLKNDFEVANGLADHAKVERNGQTWHKVQILDPATGTGTFLAEVVRKIYQNFEHNEGMWHDYVQSHLIPRLNGFEIMMSPYTMAHLKIETLLQEFGYKANTDNRLHIYLTDSLENPKENINPIPFAQWLSNEAVEAEKIKNNAPVMVILGNPPYNAESQNKSKWILRLMEDYKKEPSGGRLQEKNPKWLNDDYAKFIRFGQYFIEKNGEGILAYVNNHSFLDNPTFRGMRYSLLQTFNKIYILDLHGNTKKKETAPDGSKDENVFDIQQGVSINIFVKTRDAATEACKIFRTDLFGKRAEKYNFLLTNRLRSISWTEIVPQAPQYAFVHKNFENREAYERGFLVTDLFPVSSVGIVTAKDLVFVNDDKADLIKIIKKIFGAANEKLVQKINYRPFDTRFIYYDKKLIERPREKVMQHFIQGENVGLVINKPAQGGTDYFSTVFLTKNMTDQSIFSAMKNSPFISPLYLYHEHFGQTEKTANLNETIRRQISPTAPPEQIFDYIYAVLHSPSYREKYKEFLKVEFPRIPYPEHAEHFARQAAFGERLRRLHLMENSTVPNHFANFPQSGDNKVENSFTEKSLSYCYRKVWINGTQYFDHVPETAWHFFIGGYQPAQKWLKDRKNMALTYEDIEHYRKIIFALNETAAVMYEMGCSVYRFAFSVFEFVFRQSSPVFGRLFKN